MFRLLCKSIVIGSSVRASPVHYFLENPSILSCLRNISSVNTDDNIKEHSFTVSYLVNKCGFSLKSALQASKQVHFETPDRPDSVLAVFKNYGFSKSHILNLVRKRPEVLLSKPKTTLLPKLGFFQSKGFSSPDVIKIISSYPWVFKYSLQNQLVPAFDYLENSLQSDAVAIKAIKRFPRILNVTVETMARVVDVLRDNGVPEKNIALLIRSRPSIMVSNLENLKKLIEEVALMGFHPSKSRFVGAIRVLTSVTRSTWEKKLDVHRKWGLSEEEILEAFVKFPWFMSLSEEKIMAVMDLFVNKLGWEASYIAKNPSFSSYSLEKRLIPRASVLQFLVSKGLVEKSFRSLAFFNTPEDKFRQMYIDHHAESAQILKFYEEKLNLSSVVNATDERNLHKKNFFKSTSLTDLSCQIHH
ncbi:TRANSCRIPTION TERMINATION FACTOR FAMILY PROTEIN putative ISOFORM 1-RELATED [Salix purpurea]|uniref:TRANSCRIPTION TERMINATION FACTOR FAMILY PROTEIN putative ISOFORM 1-RELATED n=1 Tax=Salix purpurea TaxID=77065 RepID=A0A9Q0WJ19_SALPP|nr:TRANSCRIPTION TERMINATION FACTOR FAMILY PROTEIN putative ISOFORM 1-RELATED [Salix purpurea]